MAACLLFAQSADHAIIIVQTVESQIPHYYYMVLKIAFVVEMNECCMWKLLKPQLNYRLFHKKCETSLCIPGT